MKKKLIRVEKHPRCPGLYNNKVDTMLSIATLSTVQKTDKKGFDIRQRATDFSTCREVVSNSIRAMINSSDTSMASSVANQDIVDFDCEKLRLIFAIKLYKAEDLAIYKKRLFAGKRALNLLETYAGWIPQSIISTVISTENTDTSIHHWILTGPKEWLLAPQLLSLGILILRMCMFCGEFENIDEVNTESVESMLKHLHELSVNVNGKTVTNLRSSRFINDTKHFIEIRNYILPILKNYSKLFYKDLKDNWPSNDRGFGGYGGINSYVKCGTGDDTMTSKFKKLVLNTK